MTSWKTTVGGMCAAVGTALFGIALTLPEGDDKKFWLSVIGTVLSAAGQALLGLSARDNNVSSEQVAAAKQ